MRPLHWSACAALALTLGAATALAVPTPPPLAAPQLRFAAPVSHTLANGLRVVVFREPRLPIVQIQLMVPAGTADEGELPAGVAALTGQMLRQGTASRTAEQFSGDLERLGGTFSVSVTRDAAMVAAGFRAEDMAAGLELVADAALNPLFDADAFDAARRQAAQQLGSLRRNGGAIADERTWAAMFGAHPYARSPQGAIATLFATKAEHLRDFHRDRWRPDRSVLTVAGDVSPEQVFAAAEQRFGHWAGSTRADAARPAPTPVDGVRIIDVPEAPSAELRWAALAPGRASDELGAWTVAVAAINQDGALPAGARAQLLTLKDASLFVLSAPSSLADAGRTATRMREAIARLANTPPRDAALDAVRLSTARSWPLPLETAGAQLSSWLAGDLAGLPDDQLARGAAFNADPANLGNTDAAAKVLRSEVRLIAVGPADSLRAQLAPFGQARVEPVDQPVVVRPDTLAAPGSAELRRGRELVEAAAAAHGGAAKLKSVRTSVSEGDMVVAAAGSEIAGQFSMVRVLPSRLAFSNKIFDFESRQVLDGDAGWMLAQADTASLSEADSAGVASMRAILESDLVNTLRNALEPGSRAAARGQDRVLGRECELVDFVSAGGVRVRLAIDAATKRVAAIDGALGGDLVWHERRILTDYRPTGGLQLPYTEQRFVDGTLLTTFHVRKMGINPPIDEAIFRKPHVRRGRVLAR